MVEALLGRWCGVGDATANGAGRSWVGESSAGPGAEAEANLGAAASGGYDGSMLSMGNVWLLGRCCEAVWGGGGRREYCGVAKGPWVVSGEKAKGVEGLVVPPEKEGTVSVKVLDRDAVLWELEWR